MTPLNTNTARVIDPILTGIAQGYRHVERVGHVLFPPINVLARGGKVIEFGQESFYNYNARRAPGGAAKMIQFGYEGKPYALSQFTLDTPVPREHMQDAQTVPGIDLGKRSTNTLMGSLTLTLEIEQAALASNPANYDLDNTLALAGTAKWIEPESDPLADIEAAKDKVRMSCGIEPNRMVVRNDGFKALKHHPKIVERFKYTTAESITTKMLAGLFDLEELAVGKATYVDDVAGAVQRKEAWGNAAILAYTPVQDAALEQPSYGYTYTLTGHPFVEQPRWDGGTRSWIYGVTYERAPQLTGIASGFLFTGVV